jgi:ribosomal protein L28
MMNSKEQNKTKKNYDENIQRIQILQKYSTTLTMQVCRMPSKELGTPGPEL